MFCFCEILICMLVRVNHIRNRTSSGVGLFVTKHVGMDYCCSCYPFSISSNDHCKMWVFLFIINIDFYYGITLCAPCFLFFMLIGWSTDMPSEWSVESCCLLGSIFESSVWGLPSLIPNRMTCTVYPLQYINFNKAWVYACLGPIDPVSPLS